MREKLQPKRAWKVPIHIGRRTVSGRVVARTSGDARRMVKERLADRGLPGTVGKPEAQS